MVQLRSRKTVLSASASEFQNGSSSGSKNCCNDVNSDTDDSFENSSDEEFQVPYLDSDDPGADMDSYELLAVKELLSLNPERKSGAECQDTEISGSDTTLNVSRKRLNPSDELLASEPEAPRRRKYGKSKKRCRQSSELLQWEIWEEENEAWVNNNLSDDVGLDHQDESLLGAVKPPDDLLVPLLRYQKEWLSWALNQEESSSKGGILADEMGMGKTLQAIALVISSRDICGKNTVQTQPMISANELKATLVICPVVAVSQWVNEIERFTREGSIKALVYHGTNRQKSPELFRDYDFVITTYSIVETEFRKHMVPLKKRCQYCGKSFKRGGLYFHQLYYCGPHAVKTAAQSKQKKKQKNTLLKHEINIRKDENDLISNEATRKAKKSAKSRSANGSYEPVDEEINNGSSVLHSIKWNRIILDEAHFVKDRRCNTARAIFALESSYKWALTGTPLQNRVGELYSLVRFLQIVPYSYYLCKDCDCRILDYKPSSQCSLCPHNSVRHFCWWNKYISNPIQTSLKADLRKRAMILLKHKILKSILLRRTKQGRAADLALPPRMVTLRRDSLDIKEEDYYTSMYNESQAQFDTYVKAGTLMNNYAHIFDLLTRLRQAVDHPYLVVYSKPAVLNSENVIDTDSAIKDCGICHDPAEDPIVTRCDHVFCKACLRDFSTSLDRGSCPTCSQPLTVGFINSTDPQAQSSKPVIKGIKSSSILNRIELNDFQTSTKIEALKEEIRFMVERDGSAKGIVFSQFTSFLDLIHYSLHKAGIECAQLVGSMSLTQRDAVIKRFKEDPECRIFLMSLKAGGIALNLTIASHVFLMDPWWNPAVEQQAQDRIHRIGQYKPIRIIRFIIENTIEDRILHLQKKKELVFEGTVGGSSEALGKLTEEDLRFLFAN